MNYPRPTLASEINVSRCNISSAKAEVLVAITGHGPPRRYVLSLEEGNSTPTIIVPPGKARTRLLIRWLLIHVLMVPPAGGCTGTGA
ncbi:hypothetical protein AVEN_103320-1 [Araneus ventricosus]|uniref:Uncharacterized protein n=1 Tax=Araneus ventricosus TaxID=182803 RepID=A0A4Y2LVR9_ARAVE|nr:hypothetical protein AVEN_103320-1 [Araneus ventricosus]